MSNRTKTKGVLLVAYFFPPVGGLGAAGSQRTLKFAKYLLDEGWKPVVLTVREACYETYFQLDSTLLTRIPSAVTVIRTSVIRWLSRMLEFTGRLRGVNVDSTSPSVGAPASPNGSQSLKSRGRFQSLKDGITDLFAIPDGEIGWLLPAVVAGRRAIRNQAVDVIYASGKPWTAHLVGLVLKKMTGKPLVTDFRDPWMTNPFREQGSAFRNRTEAFLEKQVIDGSDIVITNTVALKEEFLRRFPRQSPDKFVALLNGYDPDDFPCIPAKEVNRGSSFVLAHTGFLYGRRDPRNFLEALALLLKGGKVDPEKIKVVFVGSVELPYDLSGVLTSCGLERVVALIPHLPFQESLQYLMKASALLLLQPGTETQVPSKLFEYIALGKPILAISPLQGATSALVADEGIGCPVDPDDIENIASAMERFYLDWERGTMAFSGNGHAREKFNVKHTTAMLSQAMDRLISVGAGD
jgi:glycosyltransferase involved in cell wall biosynthesis